MTQADLIALCDLNYAEANRELARRAGGVVHDEDGVVCWAARHPLPVLQNGLMRTDDRSDADAVLARGRTFFAARGRGYSVVVRAHADADLARAAEAARLLAMGDTPAMVLRARLPDPDMPPGTALVRVATADDVRDFATVMGASYATYGMPHDVAPMALGTLDVLAAPHIVSVLARADGAAVAGAMTIVTHGVAGIYWVGTVPEARGRGLAALVTAAAGNAGFDLGARLAALQASPMGEPVYRRMGYETVTRYPYWVQLGSRSRDQ